MLMYAEEDCLSVGVGRLVEYGMKDLKKRSRTSSVIFWRWSVDHVTCLGVFANELVFCGRIPYRLLHFLAARIILFDFFFPSFFCCYHSLNNTMSTMPCKEEQYIANWYVCSVLSLYHLPRSSSDETHPKCLLISGTSCFSGALTCVDVASMYKLDF